MISDPTTVSDAIEVLHQDVISLSDKPFLGKRVLVSLEKSNVVFQKVYHRVRTRTQIDSKFGAFLCIGQRACGTINGLTMRPNMLFLIAPGVEVDLVIEAGYNSVALLVSVDHYQKFFAGHEHNAQIFIPGELDFKVIGGLGIRSYFDLLRREHRMCSMKVSQLEFPQKLN
jgi:AraC family ethanolamine operon transcriptional activator